MRILCLLTMSLVICIVQTNAQTNAQKNKTSIGFYNLENLYDTIPSAFYDDVDYTPTGKYSWGTMRYGTKIANLAHVIDQMSMDVLGIAEVESETALIDLVKGLKTDYNYIHRTSNDRRGMDLALLYKADKFTPEIVRSVYSAYTREFLYIRGKLLKESIDIIICHLPSNFNSNATRERTMQTLVNFIDSLQLHDNNTRVILAGDFNANPSDKIMRKSFDAPKNIIKGTGFMFNPFYALQRSGLGTYVYNDRWVMFDNIMLSNSFLGGTQFRYHSSGIYIRDFMLSNGLSLRRGYPMRTFVGEKYIGGCSDHLPVYLFLER